MSITVTPTGTDLSGVGSTTTLSASVLLSDGTTSGSAAVTWRSLNPSVATVDRAGTVTAVRSGQVTIAAAAGNVEAYALATVQVPGGAPPVTWQALKPAEPKLGRLHVTESGVLYAATQVGLRVRQGDAWAELPAPPPYCGGGIWGTGDDLYAVARRGACRYDGASWTSILTVTWEPRAIWGSGPDDLHVGGTQGELIHWDGTMWTDKVSPTDQPIMRGVSLDDGTAHAIGPPGQMLYFDGSEWSTLPLSAQVVLHDLWAVDPADVVAVGPAGAAAHFDGASWSFISTPAVSDLTGVWGAASDDVFAIGFGEIIRFDGKEWTLMPTVAGWDDIRSQAIWSSGNITGRGPTEAYAAGWGSALLRFDGTEWRIESGGHSGRLEAVWGVSPDVVHAGGSDAAFYRLSRQGWGVVPGVGFVSAMWGLSSTAVYGSGSGVYAYDGVTWGRAGVQGRLDGIWGSGPDDIFAVGYLGNFSMGYTPFLQHFDGEEWASETLSGGRLGGVWGAAADDVWAGGNGVLLHWDGDSWSYLSGPQGMGRVNAMWGAASDDIFAVGESSGLGGAITHYDGASWTVMRAFDIPFILDVWGTSGEDVYAVTTGGLIHYDGLEWTDLAGFLPTSSTLGVWATYPGGVFTVGDQGAVWFGAN